MVKKKDETAEAVEDKDTWLSIHETGMAVSRKEPMALQGEGHTYEDRVKAQATSMGIGLQEGETLEHLMHRIRMGGST